MAPLAATLIRARAIKARLIREARERAEESGIPTDPTDCFLDAILQSVDEQLSNAAIDVDTGLASGEESGSYVTRDKARSVPTRAEMEEAAERMNALGIRTRLPCFTATAVGTFESLHEEFVEYCALHNVAYRLRHTHKSPAKNKKLQESHERKVEQAKSEYRRVFQEARVKVRDKLAGSNGETEACEIEGSTVAMDGEPFAKLSEDEYIKTHVAPLRLIPPELTYFQKVYRCVHAEYQADRSTGIRNQITTIYTKCPARITMEAVWVSSSSRYEIVTRMENCVHNHLCSDSLFLAYLNNSYIEDKALFERVKAQVASGGNPRLIRDQLSADYDVHFTRSMYSNLKQYHLGGGLATLNLELLIERLQSFEGTQCVMVTDQEEIVCGIIFQTRMQRELFQQYGDVLVLNWTHNTNNLGFYLGSLMATSATGKGVPVLDFLCLSQGKAMMTTVLRFFVEHNPGAAEKIKTFVIDKDSKEESAINTVVPGATVVLCQFHVVNCLKGIVASGEYKIDVPLRSKTIKSLKGMIYCETRDEFKEHQASLRSHLCGDEHAAFHAYMKRNWYNIKEKWSNYKRGRVFTAGNTTTNLIESHWKQLNPFVANF